VSDLVIDEWLWSDLAGENSADRQRESFEFLEAVFSKCDRIVIVKGSRFDEKAMEFWRHTDLTRRRIARFWKDRFWYNSDKAVLFDQAQLQDLPAQVAKDVKTDDQYLVRAHLTVKQSVVVTTDNPLKDALERHGIHCKHRQDFVLGYIVQYGGQQTPVHDEHRDR